MRRVKLHRINTFIHKHSENIAGIISLFGSSILLLSGNIQSVIAVILFTAAELILARFGHRKIGYSIGATLFAIGDLTLAFLDSIEPGSYLQLSLLSMTAAWTIGALYYPVSLVSQKVAGTFPAICGSVNLVLRIPGIITAVISGHYLIATAISAWALADIFAGRLQERVKQCYDYFRSTSKP